jgi:predicted secreted protein
VKTALNHISTLPRVRKAKSALIAAAALAISISARSAMASDIILTDGNNTVTINPGNPSAPPGGTFGAPGVNGWKINGVNQLAQEWYYFGIGSGAPVGLDSLNTVGTPAVVTESDTRGLPGVFNTAKVTYTDAAANFAATTSYQLTGAFNDPPIKGDLTETIKIANTGSSTLNLHLYEYTALQLNGGGASDKLTITGGNNATQTDPSGVYATVFSSPTSHSEASTVATLSAALTDSTPVTLNDNPSITNTNPALGYEWDLSIAPGQSITLGTDKNINAVAVPEPSSAVVLAGVAGMLLARRRTRRPIAS